MFDPAPNAELMRSLGRLVRGLSALFWGLPLGLLVGYYTAKADALRLLGVLPAMVCTALLAYGLGELGAFQKQERVWRSALDRAGLVALVNFGLSPFLYWWNRVPDNPFFFVMVILMTISALFFLISLNRVLQRLGAMLPDEALRLDISQFTRMNLSLLWSVLVLSALIFVLSQTHALSRWPPASNLPLLFQKLIILLENGGALWPLALVLLPLAMTMALLWKTKEVILDSVFGAKPPGS
jgi:hypothetical protein